MTCEECLLRQLAAFVDGEGAISIRRQMYKDRYSYVQSIMIVNTDIRLIKWLIKNFGGNMPKPHGGNENHKDSYLWNLYGSDSYELIRKIKPYLLLKQEQTVNAVELYEKVSKWKYGGGNRKRMSEYKRRLAEELYQRNKKLNMKGKLDEIEEYEASVLIKNGKEMLEDWLY